MHDTQEISARDNESFMISAADYAEEHPVVWVQGSMSKLMVTQWYIISKQKHDW